MSDYTKATDFAAKDALAPGNPAKVILGAEHDAEFELIETAIASKADKASPTFTGTVTAAAITASGAVSAASVASSGAISGTTGTFSGAISGTTGAFSGLVQANGGGGNGLGKITVSTSDPSGGSDGDIWIKY